MAEAKGAYKKDIPSEGPCVADEMQGSGSFFFLREGLGSYASVIFFGWQLSNPFENGRRWDRSEKSRWSDGEKYYC